VSPVWVAFLSGAFLIGAPLFVIGMFLGAEKGKDPEEVGEVDVTSLDGWVRFRVPGKVPLYVPTDQRGEG
jgi:hypothetical protein